MTIPEILARTVVILTANDLNSALRVFARARYLQERPWLEEVGAAGGITEEGGTAIGLAVLLLRAVGADEERIREEIRDVASELGAHGSNDLSEGVLTRYAVKESESATRATGLVDGHYQVAIYRVHSSIVVDPWPIALLNFRRFRVKIIWYELRSLQGASS